MNRRTAITLGSGLAAAATGTPVPAASTRRPVVLVHGAWHGGWCWSRLAPRLVAAGHAASAPTLTGCGERSHLRSRTVTLATHVEDVVLHIENEELADVVLLAHSYAGFVAAGVADRLGDRIAQLVLLDAFAPSDGDCVADQAGAARAATLRDAARHDPDAGIAPAPASAFGVTDRADAAWVDRRLTPHPVGSYLEPLRLARGGLAVVVDRTYIACDGPRLPVFDATKARLRDDPGWRYVSLDAPHDAMVVAPALLAGAVLDAIDGSRRRAGGAP